MTGVKNRIVCVPIDESTINKTLTSLTLPRTPNEAGLIPVKPKKRDNKKNPEEMNSFLPKRPDQKKEEMNSFLPNKVVGCNDEGKNYDTMNVDERLKFTIQKMKSIRSRPEGYDETELEPLKQEWRKLMNEKYPDPQPQNPDRGDDERSRQAPRGGKE